LFRFKVARSAAEIDEWRSAWEGLASRDCNLFQSFRWNRLAAERFAEREAPYFIFSQDDNGLAFLPAVIRLDAKTISFAGEALFDYRDYLSAGDEGPLALAWRHLSELKLPLSITSICRPHAAIWQRLPKTFFSRAPRLISSETTASEFIHAHSRAFNRLRKLERMGLEVKRYSGDSPAVRRIYELRARQSTPGELFHDRVRVDFMVAACRQEGSNCEVFTLEHGGTLAAALVTFRDEGFRRFYTTYYDRAWARYSPGVSLLFEISRRTLDEGLSFDLMTGEQSYKMRIAKSAQDLFEVKATSAQMHELFSLTASERAA